MNVKELSNIGKYNIVGDKPIGKGAHGEVWKVKGDDGKLYSLKILFTEMLTSTALFDLKREIKIMKEISWEPDCHSSIVCYVDSFSCIKDTRQCILMEYIKGDEMRTIIDKMAKSGECLSESIIKNLFKQMLEALIYLHKKGMAHRDIKPENIIIDEYGKEATLIDFGFVCDPTSIKKYEFCRGFTGTPYYLSPEFAKIYLASTRKKLTPEMKSYDKRLWYKQDVWALGLTFWEFASCGEDPKYVGPHIADNVASNVPLMPRVFEDQAIPIAIESCLIVDPDERPTAEEVLEALEDVYEIEEIEDDEEDLEDEDLDVEDEDLDVDEKKLKGYIDEKELKGYI